MGVFDDVLAGGRKVPTSSVKEATSVMTDIVVCFDEVTTREEEVSIFSSLSLEVFNSE